MSDYYTREQLRQMVNESFENLDRKSVDSKIHTMIQELLATEEQDESLYSSNRLVISLMYENLTESHIDAITSLRALYKTTDDMFIRTAVVQAVNCIAVQCRPPPTIMRRYPKALIDVTFCSENQLFSLFRLYSLMKRKSEIQDSQNARPVDEDLENFCSSLVIDLQAFCETGVFPIKKWQTSNAVGTRFARAKNSRAMKGYMSDFNEQMNNVERISTDLTQSEYKRNLALSIIALSITETNNDPGNQLSGIPASNVFQIDYMLALVYTFKRSGLSCEQMLLFAKLAAQFSFSTDISRESQKTFWHSHYEYWSIRSFMHEKSIKVHDDPLKYSFQRLLYYVSCLYPTANLTGILMIKDKAKIMKLLLDIYHFEEISGAISLDIENTSNSEHLCHQILTTGLETYVMYNKNFIKGKATECVNFNMDKVLREKFMSDTYKQKKDKPRVSARLTPLKHKQILIHIGIFQEFTSKIKRLPKITPNKQLTYLICESPSEEKHLLFTEGCKDVRDTAIDKPLCELCVKFYSDSYEGSFNLAQLKKYTELPAIAGAEYDSHCLRRNQLMQDVCIKMFELTKNCRTKGENEPREVLISFINGHYEDFRPLPKPLEVYEYIYKKN